MRPIDRMIMDAMRCIRCGAKYGQCNCAEDIKRESDAKLQKKIDREYCRLMKLSDDELIAECERLGVPVETKT